MPIIRWDRGHLAGVGRAAGPVAERLFCDADLLALLLDRDGQPLSLGRASRTITAAQFTALTARDDRCVLCAAPPTRCEGHHLTPFNAPAQGRTDIDNLALVCSSCHHEIHDHHRTLYRSRTGIWTTRGAHAEEISPHRPPSARPALPAP